jgi:hypothetical protein
MWATSSVISAWVGAEGARLSDPQYSIFEGWAKFYFKKRHMVAANQ